MSKVIDEHLKLVATLGAKYKHLRAKDSAAEIARLFDCSEAVEDDEMQGTLERVSLSGDIIDEVLANVQIRLENTPLATRYGRVVPQRTADGDIDYVRAAAKTTNESKLPPELLSLRSSGASLARAIMMHLRTQQLPLLRDAFFQCLADMFGLSLSQFVRVTMRVLPAVAVGSAMVDVWRQLTTIIVKRCGAGACDDPDKMSAPMGTSMGTTAGVGNAPDMSSALMELLPHYHRVVDLGLDPDGVFATIRDRLQKLWAEGMEGVLTGGCVLDDDMDIDRVKPQFLRERTYATHARSDSISDVRIASAASSLNNISLSRTNVGVTGSTHNVIRGGQPMRGVGETTRSEAFGNRTMGTMGTMGGDRDQSFESTRSIDQLKDESKSGMDVGPGVDDTYSCSSLAALDVVRAFEAAVRKCVLNQLVMYLACLFVEVDRDCDGLICWEDVVVFILESGRVFRFHLNDDTNFKRLPRILPQPARTTCRDMEYFPSMDVVASVEDNVVRLLNPMTLEPVRNLRDKTGKVRKIMAVCAVAASSVIVGVTSCYQLIVWSHKGLILRTKMLERKHGMPLTVATDGEGTCLFVGTNRGDVHCLDIMTFEDLWDKERVFQLASLRARGRISESESGDGGRVKAASKPGVLHSKDGGTATRGSDSKDGDGGDGPSRGSATGPLKAHRHSSAVLRVAVIDSIHCLVSLSIDGSVWSWDVRNGAVMHRLDAHRCGGCDLAVHEQSALACSGGGDRNAVVWSPNTGKVVARLAHPESVVLVETITSHFLTLDANGVFRLYSAGETLCIQTFSIPDNRVWVPSALCYVASIGRLIANGTSAMVVFDRPKQLSPLLTSVTPPQAMLFCPSTSRIVVASGTGLSVWSAADGCRLREASSVTHYPITCMCADNQERVVVCGDVAGDLYVVHIVNLAVTGRLDSHQSPVAKICCVGGSSFLTSSIYGSVRVHKLPTTMLTGATVVAGAKIFQATSSVGIDVKDEPGGRKDEDVVQRKAREEGEKELRTTIRWLQVTYIPGATDRSKVAADDGNEYSLPIQSAVGGVNAQWRAAINGVAAKMRSRPSQPDIVCGDAMTPTVTAFSLRAYSTSVKSLAVESTGSLRRLHVGTRKGKDVSGTGELTGRGQRIWGALGSTYAIKAMISGDEGPLADDMLHADEDDDESEQEEDELNAPHRFEPAELGDASVVLDERALNSYKGDVSVVDDNLRLVQADMAVAPMPKHVELSEWRHAARCLHLNEVIDASRFSLQLSHAPHGALVLSCADDISQSMRRNAAFNHLPDNDPLFRVEPDIITFRSRPSKDAPCIHERMKAARLDEAENNLRFQSSVVNVYRSSISKHRRLDNVNTYCQGMEAAIFDEGDLPHTGDDVEVAERPETATSTTPAHDQSVLGASATEAVNKSVVSVRETPSMLGASLGMIAAMRSVAGQNVGDGMSMGKEEGKREAGDRRHQKRKLEQYVSGLLGQSVGRSGLSEGRCLWWYTYNHSPPYTLLASAQSVSTLRYPVFLDIIGDWLLAGVRTRVCAWSVSTFKRRETMYPADAPVVALKVLKPHGLLAVLALSGTLSIYAIASSVAGFAVLGRAAVPVHPRGCVIGLLWCRDRRVVGVVHGDGRISMVSVTEIVEAATKSGSHVVAPSSTPLSSRSPMSKSGKVMQSPSVAWSPVVKLSSDTPMLSPIRRGPMATLSPEVQFNDASERGGTSLAQRRGMVGNMALGQGASSLTLMMQRPVALTVVYTLCVTDMLPRDYARDEVLQRQMRTVQERAHLETQQMLDGSPPQRMLGQMQKKKQGFCQSHADVALNGLRVKEKIKRSRRDLGITYSTKRREKEKEKAEADSMVAATVIVSAEMCGSDSFMLCLNHGSVAVFDFDGQCLGTLCHGRLPSDATSSAPLNDPLRERPFVVRSTKAGQSDVDATGDLCLAARPIENNMEVTDRDGIIVRHRFGQEPITGVTIRSSVTSLSGHSMEDSRDLGTVKSGHLARRHTWGRLFSQNGPLIVSAFSESIVFEQLKKEGRFDAITMCGEHIVKVAAKPRLRGEYSKEDSDGDEKLHMTGLSSASGSRKPSTLPTGTGRGLVFERHAS